MNTLSQLLSLKKPLVYILVFIIGLALRLVNLNEGLWLDEIWSMVTSSPENSISQIIQSCKSDTHPPLFDILLNIFLRLFGDGEVNGRILALIIACISLPATLYYAWKISKDRLVGFLAFCIVCLNFFHIYYSGEARFYTFLYLLSLIIIGETMLFLKEKRSISLVLYSLASVPIMYTHYYGSILIFVVAITVFFLWIGKQIERRDFIRFAIANVLILLAYLPWLPQMFKGTAVSSWMTPPNIGAFFEYLYLYTGKNPLETLLLIAGIVYSVAKFKSNIKFHSLMLGTIFLGFIVPFVVSYLSLPMLHVRYTIIYLPALILLSATFLAETNLLSIKAKALTFSLIALSIFINLFYINDHFEEGRSEPWGDVASDLAKLNAGSEEEVHSELFFYLNYYLNKHGLAESSLLSEPKSIESFWYLHTPYDKTGPALEQDFVVLKEIQYKKRFKLSHYKAN